MSTFLVIGASGQVGEWLMRAARARGHAAMGTCNAHPAPGLVPLDLRRTEDVRRAVREAAPDAVFLPASLTHVDYCEEHPEEAALINVEGVRHVARAADEAGARLVYFSSDYVFDGRAGPYREEDSPAPVCVYGRQKVEAERIAAACANPAIILRTTVVYGPERQGKNFVFRLVRTLREGKPIRVPGDQLSTPTLAADLASACIDLADRGAQGVFNVVGPERASRYEFAVEAARAFGLDPAGIESVATPALKQPAPRPLSAGLVLEKARRWLSSPMRGYREGLRMMAHDGAV